MITIQKSKTKKDGSFISVKVSSSEGIGLSGHTKHTEQKSASRRTSYVNRESNKRRYENNNKERV